MAKPLVIVESPAKAKTIEKYLGSDYRVLASYGHVRDLPAKDGSVDPDHGFAMDWENYADKAKQLKAITGNIAGASANLKNFSSSGLRQYEQLAVDARKAVDALDQTIKSIERDPSQFIFGPTQQAPEYRGR